MIRLLIAPVAGLIILLFYPPLYFVVVFAATFGVALAGFARAPSRTGTPTPLTDAVLALGFAGIFTLAWSCAGLLPLVVFARLLMGR